MPSIMHPSRPNPTGVEGQRQWYDFWENTLMMTYNPFPTESFMTDDKAPMLQSVLSESYLRKVLMLRKNIAFMQRMLSENHAEATKGGGSTFEARWLALGRAGREQALEDALAKTAPNNKCIEDWWMWAPELVKGVMCVGTGEKFTNLVRHFLVEDLVNLPSPDFPVLVNDRVWALLGIALPGSEAVDFPRPAAIRAWQDSNLVERHYFLVLVCYYTVTKVCNLTDFLAFRGFDDSVPQSGGEKAMDERTMRMAMDMMPDEHKAHFQKLVQEHLRSAANIFEATDPCMPHLQAPYLPPANPAPHLQQSVPPLAAAMLAVTAEVQSDLTLDIGEDTRLPTRGKAFDPTEIPIGSLIPAKHWPVSTVAQFTQFLRGLSFALSVYSNLVAEEDIPSLTKFNATLAQYEATQPGSFRIHRGTLDDYIFAKKQGVTVLMIMSGLMNVAVEQVAEGTFEEIYGDEMLEMPVCKKPDEDWKPVLWLMATSGERTGAA
ncbi:hypothetical protein RQP46_003510 [Phenoliferia psychrophenolica]